MSEPMSWDQFADRVSDGVIDKAFLLALEQNIIIDPSNAETRSFARFIVQVTLAHLGELGQMYDSHQLSDSFVMRVAHFMQEADTKQSNGD